MPVRVVMVLILTWNSILLILPAALVTNMIPVFLPRPTHELILSSHRNKETLILGMATMWKNQEFFTFFMLRKKCVQEKSIPGIVDIKLNMRPASRKVRVLVCREVVDSCTVCCGRPWRSFV
jgi:hypothetical protein